MATISTSVSVFPGGRPSQSATYLVIELAAEGEARLGSLLPEILRAHGLGGGPGDWWFEVGGERLDPALTLREVLARAAGRELMLICATVPPAPAAAPAPPAVSRPRSAGGPPGRAAMPAPAARVTPPAPPKYDEPASVEYGLSADTAETAALSGVDRAAKAKRAMVTRRATVRYYSRMNPDRMFPLLVILSAEQIAEVREKAVKQAESAGFRVEVDSLLELEPVLPGCVCYPPRESLPVAPEPVTATFYVVPHVLGRVQGARVVVRQGGKILSEVPLDVKVRKQTIAVLCGLLSLAAPYLMMGLRSLKLDYESQKADGFPVYQQAAAWALENVRPEWAGFGLIGLAGVAYLAMRPKKRSAFWDITPQSAR